MALNADQSAQMVEKAKAAGVLALIDHELRFLNSRRTCAACCKQAQSAPCVIATMHFVPITARFPIERGIGGLTRRWAAARSGDRISRDRLVSLDARHRDRQNARPAFNPHQATHRQSFRRTTRGHHRRRSKTVVSIRGWSIDAGRNRFRFAFRRRVRQVRKPSGDLRYQRRVDGRRDRRAVALADGFGRVAAGAGGPGPHGPGYAQRKQLVARLHGIAVAVCEAMRFGKYHRAPKRSKTAIACNSFLMPFARRTKVDAGLNFGSVRGDYAGQMAKNTDTKSHRR